MVVHVKRGSGVAKKKERNIFWKKLILRFDKYSFVSFSDFSFFSYKNRFKINNGADFGTKRILS